jgi:hypothetical protein
MNGLMSRCLPVVFLAGVWSAAAGPPEGGTPTAAEVGVPASAGFGGYGSSQSPSLSRIKPGHPRLILDAKSIDALRELVKRDELARRIYADERKKAESILTQRVSVYEKQDGKRLLGVSRSVLGRVTTLAFVRWIEDDPKYAARAWQELDAAAAFPDWNPSHFLDTAEMTRAFAIGYDWLYADWSPEQRTRLADAILEKGFKPAFVAYEKGTSWVKCDHNWNQVCHGGLGLGALAVADRFPKEAERVLSEAVRNLPIAMRAYGPDGAGLEGPTYWSYGCGYNVAFLAGMRSSLGNDAGLSAMKEFALSGIYHVYMSGAGGAAFNFSDCGSMSLSDPAHFWMAGRYKMPVCSWFRLRHLERDPGRGDAFDLLWFDPSGRSYSPSRLPLDRHFRHAEVASMRSAWDDPDALVLGIKGGDNAFNHAHLDLGSFILEAMGERWIIDSGVEKETYQRHRHKLAGWNFYRVRAEGHNTLVLNPAAASNGPDQDPKGKAAIVRFESKPDSALAELDLTGAYPSHARSVRRAFELTDRRRAVTVSDVVRADQPVDLWWFAHTEADVKISPDARSAVLEQDGKRLSVRLEAPAGARLGVMEATPLPTSPNPDFQEQNRGRRKLYVHIEGVTNLNLRVRFEPD